MLLNLNSTLCDRCFDHNVLLGDGMKWMIVHGGDAMMGLKMVVFMVCLW